jgi:hypothetical protein
MGQSDTSGACYYSAKKIAKDNSIQQRRVHSIMAELARKQVIWPEPRKRENGSCSSNLWHFTAIDGKPPIEVEIAMERKRLLGGRGGKSGSHSKRSTISTSCADNTGFSGQDRPARSNTVVPVQTDSANTVLADIGTLPKTTGGPCQNQQTQSIQEENAIENASNIQSENSHLVGAAAECGNLEARIWQALERALMATGIGFHATTLFRRKTKKLSVEVVEVHASRRVLRMRMVVPDVTYGTIVSRNEELLRIQLRELGIDVTAVEIKCTVERISEAS